MLGKILFKEFDFGEVIQISFFELALIMIKVKKLMEGFAKTIFDKSAVLGSDPAIVPPEDDDGMGIGESGCKPFYFIFKLLVALKGDKVAWLCFGGDDLFGAAVLGALNVVRAFELGKKAVLEVGGACFAQSDMKIDFGGTFCRHAAKKALTVGMFANDGCGKGFSYFWRHDKSYFRTMPTKKIVRVGEIDCGADSLFLISGPCVIEDESVMMRTAEKLKRVSEKLHLPIIYKSSFMKDNRSSVDYYSGPGISEGLKMLQRIKDDFGFALLSDVHFPEQVSEAADVLDVIQIPAYLCMQTTLVTEAAKTGKAVNLKHGQFLAPENMAKPVKKCEAMGNAQIILTERGYTFGYNDLIVDPRSFYHLNQTGYPVVFDITHSIRKYGIPSADPRGGMREFLPTLARSGVAAGVDGLFVETHPDPAKALCDAASQLCVDDLEAFVAPLMEFHDLEVKYRAQQ